MSTGSLSSCTDDELVEMIRAGGATREAAWSDMLRRYTPKMYGVARSFDIDQATAEDLVQTAWLRFLERSDQLRDTSSVGPWLCMIVRNEARRLVTRRRTVPVAASSPNALPPARTMAFTLSTMLEGSSRSVSRVPGDPPR